MTEPFMMKVIEHVYEKVMNGGSEGGSGAGTPTGDRNQSDRETGESASMAEDRVELLCSLISPRHSPVCSTDSEERVVRTS